MRTFVWFVLGILICIAPACVSMAQAEDQEFDQLHKAYLDLIEPPQAEGLPLDYQFETSISSPSRYTMHWLSSEFSDVLATSTDCFLKYGYLVEGYLFRFSGADTLPFGRSNLNLWRLTPEIGAGYFVSKDLLVTLDTLPGIYSDLDTPNLASSIHLSATLNAYYRVDDELAVGVGVLGRDVSILNSYEPFLGVSYGKKDSPWKLDLTLPIEGTLSYRFSNSLNLYATSSFGGDRYRITDQTLGRRVTILQDRDEAGLGVLWHLSKKGAISFEVGTSFLNNLERRTPPRTTYHLGSGVYGTLELSWAF